MALHRHKNRYDFISLILLFFLLVVLFNGFLTNYIELGSVNTGSILIDVTYTALIGVAIYVIIIKLKFKIPFHRDLYKIFISYILFCTFVTLIVIYGRNPFVEKILGIRNLIVYQAIFLLLYLLITNKKQIDHITNAIIISSLLLSVFAIIQNFFHSVLPINLLIVKNETIFSFYETDIVRATALLGNTIIYSSFTVILFALLYPAFLIRRTITRFICLLIVVFANIVALSRIGTAGILIIALVTHIILSKNRFLTMSKMFIFVCFFSLITYLFYIMFPDSFYIKRFTATDASTQGSNITHYIEMINAIDKIIEHPISGIGFGTQGPSSRSDNLVITDGFWFQLVLETGVVGTLLFVSFISMCLKYAFKIRKKSIETPAVSLAATFISLTGYFALASFFNSAYIGKVNIILYWAIFGLLIAGQKLCIPVNQCTKTC